MTENPYLDPSIRPQDDLFRHVNGAWLREFEIPADRAGDGAMRALRDRSEEIVRELITAASESDPAPGTEEQKIGDLYASFMDTSRIEAAGTEPLRETFERIVAAQDKTQLARLLGELEREGGAGIFGVYVSADARNSERYVSYLTQSGLHLPDEAYYADPQYGPIREQFRKHIERASDLGGLSEHTGLSGEELAESVLAFETRVAEHHWDRVACRDAEKTYNVMTWEEFVAAAEGFDAAAWAGGQQVTPTTFERLVINQPSFVTGAAQVWADTALPELKAWLLFTQLDGKSPLLGEALVEEHFDFYARTLTGTETNRERWKRGVSMVEGLLGEAVGKLYVAREFPAGAKAATQQLVDNLTAAYRESISVLDWMGEDTRARALEKLSQFTPKVGYPDEWREYDFDVSPTDIVGNVRVASIAEHHRQLDRVGGPIDRVEWLMTPQTVNAYYHPVMNEIVFPAAILQPPFFSPDADDASNYGAIGAVIGHEIGHGFDDQGSRYDGYGNLNNWWTDDDRAAFEERTGALIAQFNALVPEGLTAENHVNGELTIGENIGDLGGMGIAWKAYQIALDGKEPPVIDGLSGAQRFFVAWASAWRNKLRTEERVRRLAIDPHSPEEFRCNQIVKNMDAFHTAFDVREGDGMYLPPAERVSIW